jgi:hypothetical protein
LAGKRYHTKAARFYKVHLAKHVETVCQQGEYKGREASRNLQTKANKTINATTPTRNQCPKEVTGKSPPAHVVMVNRKSPVYAGV